MVPVAIGPRQPASGKRDEGSAAHIGVEVINNGGELDDALEAVTAWVDMIRSIRQPEGYVPPPLTKEDDKPWWTVDRLARAMTTNYVEWLAAGNDVGVEVLETEMQWEVQVPGTEFVVFGKIDAALYDPLVGGTIIRDNKSVADFGHPPEDVDFQLRTYAWAWWRLTGDVPKRVEHLMMKRVLGQGNAQPPFFLRSPVSISKRILEVHEAQLIARLTEIAAARKLSADAPVLWPNPTKDCSWRCDYRVVCPMVDDGSDWEDVLEESFAEALDEE